jgi:sugar lactone lactonase YvrE
MKKLTKQVMLIVLMAIVVGGCTSQGKWSLSEVKVVEGFDVPECMVIDSDGNVYISNVSTANEGYWEDDGKGFISKMDHEGNIEKLRWLDSTEAAPLNGPKGMCILGDHLYINDNGRLLRCSLKTGGDLEEIPLSPTAHLNDLATDGKVIWTTDTDLGKVWRITPDGKSREIQAPEKVNGITSYKDKLFAVSWGLHEVYELDPTGKNPPQPFGVADNFTNLDSIEVLDDGTFLVSDFSGNKVCTIGADRKTVTTIAELTSPADVGLDRERGLLYVPLLLENKCLIYKIEKK